MSEIDLSSKIYNINFENCLMNASGVYCMSNDELLDLKNSSSGTYITKSCTLESREGNPLPRYYDLELGSINSMGLPNYGFEYYFDYVLNEHKHGKNNIFFSLAGLSMEDNLQMLRKIENSDFRGLTELNLSCPNVPGKPQIAYDFETTDYILNKVFEFFTKPLGVKMPPYFDIVHFEMMATILNKYDIKFVTCINSVGNALYINDDSVVLKPKGGFGGLGGIYVKPTALANVRMFYKLLKKEIKVIGCGGISSGRDAFEHILCGASMVQIGTQLKKEGVCVFKRIKEELEEIIKIKGYKCLDDFRGKLKEL